MAPNGRQTPQKGPEGPQIRPHSSPSTRGVSHATDLLTLKLHASPHRPLRWQKGADLAAGTYTFTCWRCGCAWRPCRPRLECAQNACMCNPLLL
eukprot:8388296-Pyramimonas_sp.AAC.1